MPANIHVCYSLLRSSDKRTTDLNDQGTNKQISCSYLSLNTKLFVRTHVPWSTNEQTKVFESDVGHRERLNRPFYNCLALLIDVQANNLHSYM